MSDNINNTNPPSEPLTREEEYLSAIAGVTSSDDIPEKPLTRVEKYLNKIVEDGGGSVYDKLEAGTNINIEETSDGKAKISATGEVSSEDTYAREQIANHIADKDNPHEVSAADVGLGNCDNTSDLNKPISTATQIALNLKADKTELPEVPITTVKVNNEPLVPASGAVNITVPTQASDIHALADSVKYAGASTAGGSATSAAKLDTASAGSATQPVYFANGIPTATSYSLEKSVPSNAVFTDTTYESKAAASGGTDVSLCTTGEKYTWNSKQNAIDSSHKLSADLVDDTSTTNKFATAAELEQIQTNKNNILNIETQNRNKLPYTLDSLKALNTTGTWNDNVYTINNLTFTVNADMSISVALVSGETPTLSTFYLCPIADLKINNATYIGYSRYLDHNADYSATNYFGLLGSAGISNLGLNQGSDIPSDYITKYTHAIIRISSALSPQYQLWKPVIEDKTLYTAGLVDYTPYSPSNRELYELIMSYHSS